MSSVRSRVSAAILAGGHARRFGGADKASLLIDGERIIDRQLAVLSAVADDIRIVSNDPDRYAGLAIPVIPDVIPGAGALGGVYSALLATARARVLIVACDLPFVTADLLARLVAECGPDVDAVIPRTTGGLEPLCAIYAARIAPVLRRRIDSGALQVAAVAGDLRVRELGPEALAAYDRDGRLFVNVNTPHDYARATAGIEVTSEPFKDRITE